MAEKEIKIPFSYCRLSRGASFLGVEPSDLINLAIENKIEISMMLKRFHCRGNDSNLLIVFYVQIMPDDFVMQLHRF